MEEEKKYFGGWWIWVTVLMIVFSALSFILNATGIIGRTIVEREVFEQSYQYSEARKSAIATFTAQLAEIEARLADSSLDSPTRSSLNAQAASIRIQLNAERSK